MIAYTLVRTGKKVPFLDIGIGGPFFAHDQMWIRVHGDAAAALASSDNFGRNVCNFLIDGTVRPKKKYGFPKNDLGEEVEAVDYVIVKP